MISWRRRPQVRGWGTLDDVQLYIPYGIRMHKGFRHCPHVTYASFKMNIIDGYFGIPYDWVQWLTDNRPNSFNICKWVCQNCDPIHQTPLFFQRFLYIPLFVPTGFYGNVPVIWGFLKSSGIPSHQVTRRDCHGWGSTPGTSKACCNTTSSTSKWRRVECCTEPWRSDRCSAEAVVGAVWKGECDQQKWD